MTPNKHCFIFSNESNVLHLFFQRTNFKKFIIQEYHESETDSKFNCIMSIIFANQSTFRRVIFQTNCNFDRYKTNVIL